MHTLVEAIEAANDEVVSIVAHRLVIRSSSSEAAPSSARGATDGVACALAKRPGRTCISKRPEQPRIDRRDNLAERWTLNGSIDRRRT